ncbi:hypothetical protein A3A84_02545 [Candidatus Collierbacteria bacterium RIFCSPLOWO2_01_FULL_50_23]|uniref:Uncharacterized protein n=2 Tax=Candidatus Collieribacteriota TaxID=1752725 RepID=A0A1F5ER01_9BACT|nr:MAG: hypothetical protein A3D09_00585 [Candidatus Collierbacteria bacterium RIFCSPHIGHO2_02_FULL_49_10]OGD72241.1 MAG: hypothetical protein A2703_02655 [Candidatus Collierbacteria bacterium RIFCSPHIGHO2_01_FULL_50_25]OGD73836.1 MAG: hypothetical protein A3A84_02545 [Candidatus Collierbacteria bacterium RIFCSPLOWO2_01_FULL_50_23]
MGKNELLLEDARIYFDRLPAGILDQLRTMDRKGGGVYAPHQKANALGLTEILPAIEARSEIDGKFSFSEICALLTVYEETRVLAQSFARGGAGGDGVRLVLELEDRVWLPEVIEGMALFVHYLSNAAGIRERLGKREGRPVDGKVGSRNLRYWWDHFAGPLEADDFSIGKAVALEVVEVVKGLSSRGVINMEGVERWADRWRGAELAKELYLFALSDGWGL